MRVRRPWMSWSQRNELWQRWRAGESLTEIASALQRGHWRIHGIVEAEGGVAPPPRRRAAVTVTLAEREEISRGLACGASIRSLARRLRRAPSTISREVRRLGGRPHYRAQRADRRAWAHARRPKPCRLATRSPCGPPWRRSWRPPGPQQIAGWLRATFPSDADMQVSHETIYRSLFVQSRGVLKRELLQQLRRHRRFRRARAAKRVAPLQGRIVDAVSIHSF